MLKHPNRMIYTTAIIVAIASLVAVTGSAQRRITSPDGHAATEIRGHYEGAEEPVYVGGKWIEISYGRPIKRGRDLFGSGAEYGKRLNAVDMRFAKVLRFGRTKTNIGLDVYNLFNSNTATTYETVYDPATNGARWLQPTAVLLPRFMRFNVQVDF